MKISMVGYIITFSVTTKMSTLQSLRLA